MSGEVLGYLMEELLELGARDVYYSSIMAKKNRPGTMISVLCKEDDLEGLVEAVFRNTSSIGLRIEPISRIIMDREIIELDSKYGGIAFKKSIYRDIVRLSPEYEDVKRIAEEEDLPLIDLYDYFKGLGNNYIK